MKACQLIICIFFVLYGTASCHKPNETSVEDKHQCGKSNPYGVQKRVVSGTTALPGSWPWQVLLQYGFRRTFRCSGALIHPSWVLTAAHCIRHRDPSMYTVRLGEFDRTRDEGREQSIGVERVISHPRHDLPVYRNNDIALVKLKKPAKLTRWVGTVCLPTPDDNLHKDLVCYATGWGLTGRYHSYSQKLQQAHMPLVTKARCRQRAQRQYRYLLHSWRRQEITHEMLCGGDDDTGAGTCMGDSGGPYVCRNPQGYWVLQGITSWGSRSCRVSVRYSVFTKVHLYTDWIYQVMNGTDTSSSKMTSGSKKSTGSEGSQKITTSSSDRIATLKKLRYWLQLVLRLNGSD